MNYEFDLGKENSEKVMIDKVGHFSERYGYTEFKELLKYI